MQHEYRRKLSVKKDAKISTEIKIKIPERQLAGIGAVALAFNELEATIEQIFFVLANLSADIQFEISTKIGTIEKIDIIKLAAKPYLRKKEQEALAHSLGAEGFGLLKSYRDGVIHVRHLSPVTGVGLELDKKANAFDLLVRQDALDAAYDHLVILNQELLATRELFLAINVLNRREAADPDRPLFEQSIVTARHLIQSRKSERRSIPPIPKIPSETELRDAESQHQLSDLAMMIQSLGQWMVPHKPARLSEAVQSTLGVKAPPLALTNTPPAPKKKR